MDIDVKPGKYVLAVSGGVDSIVLLDLLYKLRLPLILAHFDHAMRPDSYLDRDFVHQRAMHYKYAFEFAEGNLGTGTSEETARNARYKFLRSVVEKYKADALITAHHLDDVIETAAINLLRGTGRRGISSLQSTTNTLRPLLPYRKSQIIDYAIKHKLPWREDSSNNKPLYLRNRLRQQLAVAPKEKIDKVIANIYEIRALNKETEKLLEDIFKLIDRQGELDRPSFISLPYDVSKEVIAVWLRRNDIKNYDRKLIERLTVAAKTYAPGLYADVNGDYIFKVKRDKLALVKRDR